MEGAWRKPNGQAPAKKATTVQRVSAGVPARLAEPGAYLSGFRLRMVKIDHTLKTRTPLLLVKTAQYPYLCHGTSHQLFMHRKVTL
jgi:hypothetical protein